MFNLPTCQHNKFCKNCMGDHLRSNIEDGKVVKLRCMAFDCDAEFKSEDVRSFGSSDIYAKFLKF